MNNAIPSHVLATIVNILKVSSTNLNFRALKNIQNIQKNQVSILKLSKFKAPIIPMIIVLLLLVRKIHFITILNAQKLIINRMENLYLNTEEVFVKKINFPFIFTKIINVQKLKRLGYIINYAKNKIIDKNILTLNGHVNT